MALWGSSVRTRSSPVFFAELPGGVMVAQMILVHLVGVQIPAGELGFARNFCIFQPLSISSGRLVCGKFGRFEDGTNLQMIRSKGGFVVATSQGLVSLDMATGSTNRKQLMLNFNNRFIFCSEERKIKSLVYEMNLFSTGSDVGFISNGLEKVQLNVKKFHTGYAVIKLASGFKTKSPVKLERLFIESPKHQ